jgi:hypothetical protein
MIMANFDAKPRAVNWNSDTAPQIIASTDQRRDGEVVALDSENRITLNPFELIILDQ